MSTTLSQPPKPTPAADAHSNEYDSDVLQYRAIHTGALIGLLLGIVSVAVVFAGEASLATAIMLLPIPVAGFLVSLLALKTIKANPDQYVGRPAALIGIALSALFAIGGTAFAGYVYATEVPDGYKRISFLELKPDQADERAGRPVPQPIFDAWQAGTPVFIKGYIRPDTVSSRENISEFLFVRDSNACCFGDLSKVMYFDQIQVELTNGLKTDLHEGRIYKLGGQLVINPQNLNRGPGYPVFSLLGTYVQD